MVKVGVVRGESLDAVEAVDGSDGELTPRVREIGGGA